MFSKRKTIPKEAFIPTPARIMAIIQLCLAFTALLFILGYPFMGKHYALKSRLLVSDSVIQSNSFEGLPEAKKESLVNEKKSIKEQMGASFVEKMGSSFKRIRQTPVFELAWIAFSIVIPILILLKTEGGALAAWVLPLLVLVYAIDNQQRGWQSSDLAADQLFPSERVIEEKYLGRKLSANILSQKDDLERGWRLFLIQEWAREVPAEDPILFLEQAAKGEFAFNLERASLLAQEPIQSHPGKKEPIILLVVFFLWNLFFAAYINQKKWNLS